MGRDEGSPGISVWSPDNDAAAGVARARIRCHGGPGGRGVLVVAADEFVGGEVAFCWPNCGPVLDWGFGFDDIVNWRVVSFFDLCCWRWIADGVVVYMRISWRQQNWLRIAL
jgi:hypothetical protein